MVELIKDVRRVIKKENGYVFSLEQEQVYEKAAVENMIAAWKDQERKYGLFLENYEHTIEAGIAQLKEQMQTQKDKVLKDLTFVKEGIVLWENPEEPTSQPK